MDNLVIAELGRATLHSIKSPVLGAYFTLAPQTLEVDD